MSILLHVFVLVSLMEVESGTTRNLPGLGGGWVGGGDSHIKVMRMIVGLKFVVFHPNLTTLELSSYLLGY